MPVFADQEQFYAVMQEVFDFIVRHPQHIETFTRSNLVIRMRTTQPDAETCWTGANRRCKSFWPYAGLANLEVSLTATCCTRWARPEHAQGILHRAHPHERQLAEGHAAGGGVSRGRTHLSDVGAQIRLERA